MLSEMDSYSFEKLLSRRITILVGTPRDEVIADVLEHSAGPLFVKPSSMARQLWANSKSPSRASAPTTPGKEAAAKPGAHTFLSVRLGLMLNG